VAAGPSTARSTVEEAGTRATLPSRVGQGEVAGGPGPPGGCGPRRPRLPTERPGRPGRGGERPSRRLRGGHGSGLQPEVAAPATWRSSSSWGRDHGAWSSPSLTPGWADPEGPLEVPAGWACGPSAAQADGGRSRPAAGSAVTCDDGWWACQDLNLGPHPYQQSQAERHADRCFPWSSANVEGQVILCNRLLPHGAIAADPRCQRAQLTPPPLPPPAYSRSTCTSTDLSAEPPHVQHRVRST
jgi:hypothetical protein